MTIPAEIRDFPEWHRGRDMYVVWVLRVEDPASLDKFNSAREHLKRYLLKTYRRQPHITLFVCGFLGDVRRYNDDFTQEQFQTQLHALEMANIQPFEIEIGVLNSFASAPFLEVNDPQGNLTRLRAALSNGTREFGTTPYAPHLTVGLYADKFDSQEVIDHLNKFPTDHVRWQVGEITLASYQASEITGPLNYLQKISFGQN